MSKQPPLQWLRSFVVSAKRLSFTQASVELSLTQAAISKHIKGLESWLGLQLFIREAHGIALTEQGRRYYEHSAPLLEKLDQLTWQVATRSQRDRLRIRCNISYGVLLLPDKLKQLKTLFPETEIDINHGIFEPDHPSENAHLEIGYAARGSLKINENQKLLADDFIFPVAAPDLSLIAITTLPLLTVSGYTGEWNEWLKQQKNRSRHKIFNQWLLDCAHLRKCAIRSDNSLTVYQLCAQGLGVAMARTSFVQPLLDNGQLKTIKQAASVPSPDIFFARLTARGQTHPAAKTLFGLM